MAFSPSVGDILMLSQLAWKIGRAFTSGKKSAPSEFAEVEREANGLSEALKLVAETLHGDDSILAQADRDTQLAVSTILDSARTTLSDLESFVDRYRVMKQKKTETGFLVERAWSEAVLANYRKIQWTTEGGDISELREILHMHTNTLQLTMQALQSRSLARLERTVIPMAENVASIHDKVNGDLGDKIDDLHRVIMTIANATPSLHAIDREEPKRLSDISDSTVLNSTNTSPIAHGKQRLALPYRIPTRESEKSLSPISPPRSIRGDPTYWSTMPKSHEADRGFENGSPPPDRDSIGNTMPLHIPPSGTTLAASPSAYEEYERDRRAYIGRRESETVPRTFAMFDDPADYQSRVGASVLEETPPSSWEREHGFPETRSLPPPALPAQSPSPDQLPATPATFFASVKPQRTNSDMSNGKKSPVSRTLSVKNKELRSPVISSAAKNFEKALFRNAAILCDVRGTKIEYAQNNPDEPDPRYATEMISACADCRIYVIRRREHQSQGGTKIITSIWAISDDGIVRCQQAISDLVETVPYCSYFQPEKVSLPPTEGDVMRLRFHRESWGLDVEREVQSNWINYIFESEIAANSFQSAIFGRTLLGSFRTLKTSVIHEGLKGAFAFEESFANIEVLRLWEDDGTAQAGAQGGVLALLHLGSNFGEGWARWWINSSKQQVRIKDEQTKFAKVKGIDVRVIKPGMSVEKARQDNLVLEAQRRASDIGGPKPRARKKSNLEKQVTGVRIEFKTEEEREKFVQLAKRTQELMIPLPDV